MLMEAAPAGIDVRRGRGGDGRGARRGRGARPARVDRHVRLPGPVGARGRAPGADRDDVAAHGIERMLEDRFDIHHTTLQVVECAEPEELIQLERRSPQRCGAGDLAVVDCRSSARKKASNGASRPAVGASPAIAPTTPASGYSTTSGWSMLEKTATRQTAVRLVRERMRSLGPSAEHRHVTSSELALALGRAQRDCAVQDDCPFLVAVMEVVQSRIPGSISNTVAPSSFRRARARRASCARSRRHSTLDVPIVVIEIHGSPPCESR